ncbi:hypothetical protein LMG26690_05159 [Achromobacter animicus]|jgi:hypothetical protein|uniref:Uncharacterized protein n=1 Tax=Achromobacter animicus TaxID=1389935 RepID=A0A6S7C0I6_9BURK|nr:hypothetical protein [Achromobacter animicus]CAB3734980.1 hypothetical protein LMG26690_05159 [Achromobacter animicus]
MNFDTRARFFLPEGASVDDLNSADVPDEEVGVSELWPSYMQSKKVHKMCALARLVSGWIEEQLYRVGISTCSADHLSLTAFSVVHEHHKSCVLLVEEGLFGSAAALMRPSLEAYFRGLWLQWAEGDELQKFQEGKHSLEPQRFIKQLLQRSKVERYGDLLPMWEESKQTLHGYVHHGYQSLVRRSGEVEVTAEEVTTMLKFSTGLALHASLDFTELVARRPPAGEETELRQAAVALQGKIVAFMRALDLATVR